MSTEEKIYRCMQCGKEFSLKEIIALPGFRCPYCGFRIVEKTRPVIPKRVRAV
ncbi:MAG: DNA-directed RNA polymerase subunit P [Infirmifilum sp.]